MLPPGKAMVFLFWGQKYGTNPGFSPQGPEEIPIFRILQDIPGAVKGPGHPSAPEIRFLFIIFAYLNIYPRSIQCIFHVYIRIFQGQMNLFMLFLLSGAG